MYIIKPLPFKTKLNLAMASAQLRKLMVAEKYFTDFDLSFFVDIDEDVLRLATKIAPGVKVLKIAGPLFDVQIGQTLDDVLMPFRFLHTLKLSHTHTVLNLDFLSLAPCTLRHLQLDFLHMLPAIEFVRYVPAVASHLTVLEMRKNVQLTKYDLVNILQWFKALEVLDICATEYLTPGTCQTIARYCNNLEKFFFSLDYRPSDCKAWIALLGMDIEHMEFTPEVYKSLNIFYMIEPAIENGEDFDVIDDEWIDNI